MTIKWTISEINEANPSRPGAISTPLSDLLSAGAIHETLVCQLAELLEAKEQPHLAAFFQLPYSVSTSDEWVKIPASEKALQGTILLSPSLLTFDYRSGLKLTPDTDGHLGYPVTQGVLLLPYWGRRAKAYPKYLSCFKGYELLDRVVATQAQSWRQNRQITASAFEFYLPERIEPEIKNALRIVLPAMSVCSLVELPIPETSYNFFVMPSPGRLSRGNGVTPLIDAFLPRKTVGIRKIAPPLSALQSALAVQFRSFSLFEQQLFAMNALLADGELSSAHIGTIGLMEHMIRQYVGEPEGSKRPFAMIIKHPELNNLPEELMADLRRERDLRNDLVHGYPLDRFSLTISGNFRERGRQIAAPSRGVTYESVGNLIETAFSLFREMNRTRPGFWVGA